MDLQHFVRRLGAIPFKGGPFKGGPFKGGHIDPCQKSLRAPIISTRINNVGRIAPMHGKFLPSLG